VARRQGTAELVERVRSGDRRAVARLISLVENGTREELREVAEALNPLSGRATVLGLTGSPGVGKSTLANALVAQYRNAGRTVGVLAVDPSSPFSGGALLGDRVRMQHHASDQGVYIRSMATRGHLGGLARATPQAVRVLDAAGCEVVLVETVGVGQAEVEVAGLADTTVVVVAPGFGDAVQAAKAGILEVADVFVVNKADREGAGDVVRDLKGMLRMGPKLAWEPPIVKTSTVNGEGIDELWEAISGHRVHLEDTGQLEGKRRRRVLEEVESMVALRLRARTAGLLDQGAEAELADDLAARRIDPYRVAGILLEKVGPSTGESDG